MSRHHLLNHISAIAVFLLLCAATAVAQKTVNSILGKEHFDWQVYDDLDAVTMYYLPASWVSEQPGTVAKRIVHHLQLARDFAEIENYGRDLSVFVVNSRQEMEQLVGHETNGIAFPKHDMVIGIASEELRSVYANHEYFHVVATNTWGKSTRWLNEGMAVYSDNNWHGHDLYTLTCHLSSENRLIPLRHLIRRFTRYDTGITYPQAGSFARYLCEEYGMTTVRSIWSGNMRKLRKITGKTLTELELDWLAKASPSDCDKLDY